MGKKKKNKKIKKAFIEFLNNLKKQVELIPPKYWNKQF